MKMKKQRTIWLSDDEFNKLKSKAQEQGFRGKGFLEKFIRLIAYEKIVILKGFGEVKISVK